MKQVFNKKGVTVVDDVPVPAIAESEVLVKVYYSCISTGTELSNLNKASEPLLKKVINNPDKLKKLMTVISEKGINGALEKVRDKLSSITPIGYSAAGIIVDKGSKASSFLIGDRVACAGAGIANHSEFISVPENLTIKIPGDLSFQEASTVALGGIAMQGVRRASAHIGEYAVIFGLGILGQITAQLLKSSGCFTIGIDINQDRVDMAVKNGLDLGLNPQKHEIVDWVLKYTNEFGADHVIITASSSSDKIINQSIEICRRKGKVIIVGDVSLNILREDFYKRELDLLMSTSYGPGRYDESYEIRGFDYPYSYVRWTEKRNMSSYLEMLSRNKAVVKDFIKRVFKVENADNAYAFLKSDEKPLVVLLEYEKEKAPIDRKQLIHTYIPAEGAIKVGIIGAGNFAKEVHIPNLVKLSASFNLMSLCSKNGYEVKDTAEKHKITYITTDYKEILNDSNIDAVMICTRHNLHSQIAREALINGKSVFLEKPMALNKNELESLVSVINESGLPFTVGFNRRFSFLVNKIKEIISSRVNPLIINYQMNAGYIEPGNWVFTEEGGGRNIGEACHIYDLFNYLINDSVSDISVFSLSPKSENYSNKDNFSVNLKYKDGSVCNLIYTSMGNRIAPKEEMQIFCDGKVIKMSDYKSLEVFDKSVNTLKLRFSDKGHYNELKAFADSVKSKSGIYPIPLWQLIQATETSFKVEELLNKA